MPFAQDRIANGGVHQVDFLPGLQDLLAAQLAEFAEVALEHQVPEPALMTAPWVSGGADLTRITFLSGANLTCVPFMMVVRAAGSGPLRLGTNY
jgi:hypothetical protein